MLLIIKCDMQEQLQQMQRQREMLLQQPMLGQLHPMFAPPMTYMPVLGVVRPPLKLRFHCWPDTKRQDDSLPPAPTEAGLYLLNLMDLLRSWCEGAHVHADCHT